MRIEIYDENKREEEVVRLKFYEFISGCVGINIHRGPLSSEALILHIKNDGTFSRSSIDYCSLSKRGFKLDNDLKIKESQ
jgi:hypothetical protein